MPGPHRATLASLPDQVLGLVFAALPAKRDVHALSSTCRRLNDFYLTAVVTSIAITRQQAPHRVARALARCPRLAALTFRSTDVVRVLLSMELPVAAVAVLARVRELRISHASAAFNSCDLERIAVALPGLRRLRLEHVHGLTNVRALGHLPALEELWLLSCSWAMDFSGLATATTLTRLGVSFYNIRDDNFLTLEDKHHLEWENHRASHHIRLGAALTRILPSLTRLSHLDLDETPIAPSVLSVISGRVKDLSCGCVLGGVRQLRPTAWSGLPLLARLQFVNSRDMRSLHGIEPLERQLTTLSLPGSSRLRDEATAEALLTMGRLERLKLSSCAKVGDAVARAAATLPRLRKLCMESTRVTGVGVRALAAGAARQSLILVCLTSCKRVTAGSATRLRAALGTERGAQVLTGFQHHGVCDDSEWS